MKSKTEQSGKLQDAIPSEYPVPPDLKQWIFENSDEPWRTGEKEKIKKILNSSPEFSEAKQKLKERSLLYRCILRYIPKLDDQTAWIAITAVGTIILAVLGLLAYCKPPLTPDKEKSSPIPQIELPSNSKKIVIPSTKDK